MKKIIIGGLLALSLPLQLLAQISTGGVPYGSLAHLSQLDIPTLRPAPFNATLVAEQDQRDQQLGKVPRYGVNLDLFAEPTTSGQWTTLGNGDRLWRARVLTDGAQAIELDFDRFALPEGSVMFIYDEQGHEVLGGFGAANNRPDGVFTTSLIHGASCIVEYYEPAYLRGEGTFRIAHVGHAYRMVETDRADDCEVDVNCPEGSPWVPQVDGVVRISIRIGSDSYWCTGSLVNNVRQDCKAYYLTANHCTEGVSVADYAFWKFYFRYQRTGCNSGSASAGKVLTGCSFRASSEDNGGQGGSDFYLVEGDDAIPATYTPYWEGWDANNTAVSGAIGIHHPSGDEKKISTTSGSTQSATWFSVPGTHWRVHWGATTSGHGVTEPGSSGSPLFNSSGRIIGTLTGGSSACESVQPGGSTQPDFYGKMSYHWVSDPGDDLKTFLDPDNTGTVVMNGSYGPCGTLDVEENAAPSALRVWPVPADERLNIAAPASIDQVQALEITDLTGRVVRRFGMSNSTMLSMDVRSLAPGAYVLSLIGKEKVLGTARVQIAH